MIDLVKKSIIDFVPYDPNQIPYRVKLDANESPFTLSDKVGEELTSYLKKGSGINLYPDTNSNGLRQALAAKMGFKTENLLAGTGSDEIIQIIINTFVEQGDRVVCPVPSFIMYKMTTIISGGIPVEVPLDSDYRYDTGRFLDAVKENNVKVAFLCTPNNPTGSILDREEIIHVLKETSGKCIVAVDEAYYEFYGKTCADLIEEYDNLIVLRTFSKAYGLAGLRVGYSISNELLNSMLHKVKPPYNLSSFSQKAAQLVLADEDRNMYNLGYIKEQRDRLLRNLSDVEGIEVFPSKANFILIKIANGDRVNSLLEQRGILVRSFGNTPMLENCLRITVGSKEDNELFMEEFKSAVKEVEGNEREEK